MEGGAGSGSGGHLSNVAATFKILVSHRSAGALIGKKGATRDQLQQETGTTLRISNSKQFFPGTTDRVVVCLAPSAEAAAASLTLLIGKFFEAMHDAEAYGNGNGGGAHSGAQGAAGTQQLKFVIPNTTAGFIIGKAGQTVNAIKDQSGCNIQISNKDDQVVPIRERVVTLTGTQEQLCNAGRAVLSKIAEDPHCLEAPAMSTSYPQYTPTPEPAYQAYQMLNATNPMYAHQLQAFQQHAFQQAATDPNTTTIKMEIADRQVGAIVGRAGVTIRQLQQASGASIKVSQKDEFFPGTPNRMISITGTPATTQLAQYLIQQQIQLDAAQQQQSHLPY